MKNFYTINKTPLTVAGVLFRIGVAGGFALLVWAVLNGGL